MSARLLRGIGANLYGQIVTVVVQLVSVPLLLHAWGGATLGAWLTVSAWTSLLTLTDGGLMVAAGTAMTMAVARGDPGWAARLFRQLLRFVLAVGCVLGLAAAAAVLWWPQLSSDGVADDLRPTCLALALAALVGLPLGTAELGFRAGGDYATGMAGTSTVRLLETGAAVAIAIAGGGLAGAASALLLVRCAGALVLMAALHVRAPWLSAAPGGQAGALLGPLLRPALAAAAVPASLALGLQGTTIAASLTVPAGSVAVFVASRTLTRALVQALGLVTHALMPELAMAAGRGDRDRSSRLIRLNLLAGSSLLVPGWALLVAYGPALTSWWTGGALRPDTLFFSLMATAALAHGCWLSAANLLLAVNRQGEVAYRGLAMAAVTCFLAGLLSRWWSLDGIAEASLAGEIAMVAIVVPPQIVAAFARRPQFQPAGTP